MTMSLLRLFRKLLSDKRAITSGEIIGLAVSFFIVAVMAPISIGIIANMTALNQTFLWDPAVITIFQVVLPIIWVVGVALKYLPGRE